MKREERNKLVLKNIGLVYKVVKGLSLNMGYEDMIQEGTIGLIKAVEMYNPKRCREFSTYACICIRSHIIRAYQNKETFMRIPVPMHEQYSKMSRVKGFADMVVDQKYDLEYLSKETGLSSKRIEMLIELLQSYTIDISAFDESIQDTSTDIDQVLDCKNTLNYIERKMSNYTELQRQSYRQVFLEGKCMDHLGCDTHIYMIRKKLRRLFKDGVPECIK